MPYIGSAYMNVVPKFPGLASQVKAALGGVDVAAPGTRMGGALGGSMAKGFVKAGAVAGAVSAVTSKVAGEVSAHVGAAISRFDILNNYPRVMENLGYTSAQATASITEMSDRLQGLPTRLDAMVSSVQGFTAITGDIEKSTKLGLALNDALLAGGQGSEVASRATEQFRQVLAKGKPELEDWRALTSAAPGQMDMLAKSMLGAEASANDLYYALGGGDQKSYDGPHIAIDDLIDKIIELDEVGADGLASFRQQAEEATGGLQTSLENLSNAWTRGIADTFDTVGTDRVARVVEDMKGAVRDGFAGFNDALEGALPAIDTVYSAVKGVAADVGTVIGDLVGSLSPVAGALVDSFAPAAESLGDSVKVVAGAVKDAVDAVAPFAADVIGRLAPYAGDIAVFAGSFSLLQGAGAKVADFCGKAKGELGKVKGAFDALKGAYGKGGPADAIVTAAEAAVEAKGAFAPIPAVLDETSGAFSAMSGRVNEVGRSTGGLRGAFAGMSAELEAQRIAADTAAQGYMSVRDAIALSGRGTGDWKETLAKFTPELASAGTEASKTAGELFRTEGMAAGLGAALDTAKGKVSGFCGAAKDGIGRVAKGIGAFMGAGGLGLVVTGGALAGSAVATAVADAREKADNLRGATEGLKQAAADAGALRGFSGAVEEVGQKAELSVMSVDELAEAGADLADSISRRTEAAQNEIVELERARKYISDYAGQAELTAEQTGRVKWAIDKVNEALGTNLTLEDVKSNRWVNEAGEVEDLKGKIDELIEKKKEEVRAEAITADLSEAYDHRTEAAKTYGKAVADAEKARKNWEDHKGGFDEAGFKAIYDAAMQEVERTKGLSDEADQSVKNLESSYDATTAAMDENADAWTRLRGAMESDKFIGVTAALQNVKNTLTGGAASNEEFLGSLQELGVSADEVLTLEGDKLTEVAAKYDGTASSIVEALRGVGVSVDEGAVKAAALSDALRLMGGGVPEALSAAGTSATDLGAKLAEAGVSAEQLNAVGSANIAALAEAFQGNTDKMVWAIQNYNNVPIVDKDGSVTVNDAQLIDSQGRVVVWNGTEFVDKETGVAVDDQMLIDAQGRVWVWNDGELKPYSTTATVTGNVVDGSAQRAVSDLVSALSQLHDKKITVQQYELVQKETRYITSTANGGQTSGGLMKADGGVIFHGSGGFIADRPGAGVGIGADRNGVNHFVGEAGAEAVVPLTNRRYAAPFADLIAELVAGRQAPPAPQYNLYVDGASLAADKAASRAIEDLARVISRKARTARR